MTYTTIKRRNEQPIGGAPKRPERGQRRSALRGEEPGKSERTEPSRKAISHALEAPSTLAEHTFDLKGRVPLSRGMLSGGPIPGHTDLADAFGDWRRRILA